MVKNPPLNAGDEGLIPESGKSPGEGNDNLLQYSCLENPRDRGTWWAAVLWVTKSDTVEHTHTPGMEHFSPIKMVAYTERKDAGYSETCSSCLPAEITLLSSPSTPFRCQGSCANVF